MTFEIVVKRCKEALEQRPLIFVGGVLSVLALLLMFFASPDISKLKDEYKELSEVEGVMDYNLVNGMLLNDDLKMLNVLNQEIQSRLLNPDDRADIFHYFFSFEDETGVIVEDPREIETIKIPLFENKKKLKDGILSEVAIVKYKLDVIGLFPQLLNLINKIQTGHYFARITRLSISRSDTLNPDELRMNLDINYFGVPD